MIGTTLREPAGAIDHALDWAQRFTNGRGLNDELVTIKRDALNAAVASISIRQFSGLNHPSRTANPRDDNSAQSPLTSQRERDVFAAQVLFSHTCTVKKWQMTGLDTGSSRYWRVATPILASDVIPLAYQWGTPALPRLVSVSIHAASAVMRIA